VSIEIERRFLVIGTPWSGAEGTRMEQAYVACEEGRTVRIRRAAGRATLTIKGPTVGAARPEFELAVEDAWASACLDALKPPGRIVKTRYRIPAPPHVWEVDVFEGDNHGLVLAEIELAREDEAFARPAWLGPEVTSDGRYSNAALARTPWIAWGAR
jgi:adenylate cyclase